ncbi:urea ABC transporter permease subunit UrtC [bacterium]|jgi:urea transport system permease protein|nr:urea ABC transporter permease subunit UrtC [bacterium]
MSVPAKLSDVEPRFFTRAQWASFLLPTLLLALVLPLLNALLPSEHLLRPSDFTLNLYGKYATYAVLALGVDLLWGFLGILSLGQALFFALGGYAFGMHLLLMIGKDGQYKSKLPDYMVFLGYKALPVHWQPFYSFSFATCAVLVIPALIAFVFGWLAFRSRIKGVYLSILTQALTYAAALLFFRNDFGFGGNNGFTDFKRVLGADLNSPTTRRVLYVSSVLLLAGVFLLYRWLTRAKFGHLLQAIRDGENRVLFSGYATASYKLFVFVLVAAITGIAGALYVPQVGIINPSEMTPEKSLEAVVWVAVGGRGTLLGPVLGAFFVNALKSWATRSVPELWLYIIGGLFIVVVLFLPGGLISLPARFRLLWARYRSRASRPDSSTFFQQP